MGKTKRKRTRAQIEADAHRTGRPPKDPAHRLSDMIGVRVSPAERTRLETEARRRGISLSALLMKPWRKGG